MDSDVHIGMCTALVNKYTLSWDSISNAHSGSNSGINISLDLIIMPLFYFTVKKMSPDIFPCVTQHARDVQTFGLNHFVCKWRTFSREACI